MQRLLLCFSVLTFSAETSAQGRLERIYFNPYTDSIKPVLNYYVNVEGIYKNGCILPLDTGTIVFRCSQGSMRGNEWVLPKLIDFDRVSFFAVAKENDSLRASITLYIQKRKDPRDE